MKKQIKDIREIPASGNSNWMGGAYTIAFVYSNKGNFVLKGYLDEVKQELNKLKSKGYKYFVNFTLWYREKYSFIENQSNHRSIWAFWREDISISKPAKKTYSKGFDRKWEFYIWDFNKGKTVLAKFKRLPKKWIPEFENF